MAPLYVRHLSEGTSKLAKNHNLTFVSDSQDVEAVKEHLGKKSRGKKYDSFYVATESGEYTVILGMHGIIPYLNKRLYRVR